MARKVGDIIKLVPVEETKPLKWNLILNGLDYTEDSKFKIIDIDEYEPLDGERYLVDGINGENDKWNDDVTKKCKYSR